MASVLASCYMADMIDASDESGNEDCVFYNLARGSPEVI